MKKARYINILKKRLSVLDSQSRNDIIREIESQMADSDEPILERFGSPESLAASYLEDMDIETPIHRKVLGVGKKLLGFIAVIVFLLFAIGLVLYWNYKGDRFNYADTEAVELTSSEDWVTIDWTGDLTLEVEQAQTVIYWHNEPTVRGNCKRETIDKKHFGNNLRIRHDNCLLVLPNTAVVASTNEADIVIVQPLASINMQSERSNIRIATNDQPYRFALSADNSKVGTFDSAEDAPVTISIESRHATIMPYTQR